MSRKTAWQNAYADGKPINRQEARPLKTSRGVRCLRTEPSASWEPRSMKQSELDDYQYSGEHPWRNKEIIYELYIEKQYSTVIIAELWDCSPQTICNWLERYNIPRRSMSEAGTLAASRSPAHYLTDYLGYERWKTAVGDNQYTVSVHRVAAVAWFGIEAVKDKYVHHKIPIPWLNTESNLEMMEPSEHSSHHMSMRVDKMVFDEDGNISGWER